MNFPPDIFSDLPEIKPGEVWLVGAGPGDPRLLTVLAIHALRSADTIVHDALVDARVLKLAAPGTEIHFAGKRGGKPSPHQRDINELIIAEAKRGRRVVRLKGGDPMIFGRAAEEIEICRANGIAVEVIPGITAALGAAAELQLPLTDRRHAQRLQFVTGHAKSGRAPQHDWASLARDDVTTVFYMGARTFAEMLPQMLSAGLPPDMPALAISGATTPHSRRIAAPVAQLPAVLPQLPAAVPCLILVGRCAAALDETQAMAEALRA